MKKLKDYLKYEQPTKYIVESENYNDNYNIPVLTAGKSFILGYTNETENVFPKSELPVIIFDDFTTDCKYVDFPFKVKSSAMKILHPINNANAKFLYYFMKNIEFDNILHKRYWISEYSHIEINDLDINKQNQFSNQMKKIEKLIDIRSKQVEKCDNLIKSQFVEMFETETNIKTLDDVCKKITDGSHNPPKGVNYETEYLMLSSQNINGGRINFNNPRYLTKENFDFEHKRTNIEKGDILLTIVGTVGRTAIVNDEKVTLQRSVAVLKLTELVNSYFMSYSFQNEFVSSQLVKGAKGVAQKGIYLGDLKKLNLKVPPIELQNKFAQIVEQIDKQKFELENSLKKLEELQASLMQEYFG